MPLTFVPEPVTENGSLKYTGAIYPAKAIAGAAQHNLALATTGGVALTVPPSALYGNVQAKAANVSYTLDGTAASATVGTLISVGAVPVTLPAASLATALFYSASGTLDVEYFM